MARVTLAHIHKTYLDAHPDLLVDRVPFGEKEGKKLPPFDFGKPTKADIKQEKALQGRIEEWLRLRGYWRRSDADLTGETPDVGWQMHFHRTRTNPIVLDVLLLRNDRHWFEFELKRPGGKFSSAEQRNLCCVLGNPIYTTFESATAGVEEWEKTCL